MKINAKSPQGNVFFIMGTVMRLLEDASRGDEWLDVKRRMMSGDYNNACNVAEEVSYGSIKVVTRK